MRKLSVEDEYKREGGERERDAEINKNKNKNK
jgi:hypothetical protein